MLPFNFIKFYSFNWERVWKSNPLPRAYEAQMQPLHLLAVVRMEVESIFSTSYLSHAYQAWGLSDNIILKIKTRHD